MTEGRKSLSLTARFRIFHRDSFTCQYCGRKPPEIVLEVDHIRPVSEGGTNDELNLVTSCFECNRGKGATSLECAPTSLHEAAAQAQERMLQVKRMAEIIEAEREAFEDQCWAIAEIIQPGASGGYSRANMRSIRMFVRKIGYVETCDAAYIAAERHGEGGWRFRYFCGVCWNKTGSRGGDAQEA